MTSRGADGARAVGSLIAPLVTIAFGVAVAVGGTGYEIGTATEMGPGFFPVAVGIAIAALGAMMAVGAVLNGAAGPGAVDWRPLLAVTAALAAFALTVERLGFAPATVLLVAIAATAEPALRWRRTLVLAVVLVAGCWAIFILGLGMKLDLVEGL